MYTIEYDSIPEQKKQFLLWMMYSNLQFDEDDLKVGFYTLKEERYGFKPGNYHMIMDRMDTFANVFRSNENKRWLFTVTMRALELGSSHRYSYFRFETSGKEVLEAIKNIQRGMDRLESVVNYTKWMQSRGVNAD